MAAVAVKKVEYRVPRSFRLRHELEVAEKGGAEQKTATSTSNKPKDPHAGFISFGLGDLDEKGYDTQLCNWNGTIIGPQSTALGERIYQVKIHCGPRYPDVPPTIHFVTKIVMEGVDQRTGLVSGVMKTWTRKNTMYDYLAAIRNGMTAAAKLKQPGPNEVFQN